MDYVETLKILIWKMAHGLNGLLSVLALAFWIVPALLPQLSIYFERIGEPRNLLYVSASFVVISGIRSIHQIRMENGGLFYSTRPVVDLLFDLQNWYCISYIENTGLGGGVVYKGHVCLSVRSKVSKLRGVKVRLRENAGNYFHELGYLKSRFGVEGQDSLELSEGEVAYFQLASVWSALPVPDAQVRDKRSVSDEQVEIYLKYANEKGLLIEVPTTIISDKPFLNLAGEMKFYVDVFFENAHSVVSEVAVSGPPNVEVKILSTKALPQVE